MAGDGLYFPGGQIVEMTLQEFPEREPLAIGGEAEESGELRDWGGALALLQE